MRNLKEALSNNVFMSNGDELIRNSPQTDPFFNDEPIKDLTSSETNVVLDQPISTDTGQTPLTFETTMPNVTNEEERVDLNRPNF